MLRLTKLPLAISLFAYGVSLALPAFELFNQPSVRGYEVLALGLFGILSLNFAWYANTFYLLSVIAFLIKNYKFSSIAVLLAFFISLQSLTVHFWWYGGKDVPILHLASGFYAWVTSFVVLAIASIRAWRLTIHSTRPPGSG